MLGSLSPARRRLVVSVTGLVVLAVAVVAVLLLRQASDDVDPVDQTVLGPVLVVPGYGGAVGSVDPLRQQLEADGRVAVVVPPPGDGTGDLEDAAAHLREVADQVMQDEDASSVDVVAFSAGGVIARLFVRDHGGASITRRVLTIGSPHHGSDVAAQVLAAAGTCPAACQQMDPDSSLLRALNAGDETPPGPTYVSIWTVDDRVSTPPDTARLAGAALNLTVQSVCPDLHPAHGGLPADPVVLALLGSALGPDAPRAPTGVDCDAG